MNDPTNGNPGKVDEPDEFDPKGPGTSPIGKGGGENTVKAFPPDDLDRAPTDED